MTRVAGLNSRPSSCNFNIFPIELTSRGKIWQKLTLLFTFAARAFYSELTLQNYLFLNKIVHKY